jgi:uncharacterized protein
MLFCGMLSDLFNRYRVFGLFAFLLTIGLASYLVFPAINRPQIVVAGPASEIVQAATDTIWGPVLEEGEAPGSGAPLVSICKIQGSGFSSPYNGKQVRTRGVVIADLDQTGQKGFYIQEDGCDDKTATSDGIFIYLGVAQDAVQTGDLVEIAGLAQEYFGLTEISTSPASVTILSSGLPLPAVVELSPPFDQVAARAYFESLEGMYVSLADGTVVGPSSKSGDTWLVRSDLEIGRVFHGDPRGTGEIIAVDGDGLVQIEPDAAVGDRVLGLTGPLGFRLGDYRLHLLESPAVISGEAAAQVTGSYAGTSSAGPATSGSFIFEVVTFNAENLFDPYDDPGKEDPIPSAASYQRHLDKLAQTIHDSLGLPHVIALQEIENMGVLEDLLDRPELSGEYTPYLIEGPDQRGIDVALLVRSGRSQIISFTERQGCTGLIDGLGPDGNQDMANPQNDLTCDLDGDGVLDGNRLFSRPPLVAHLRVCNGQCVTPPGVPPAESIELWVIANHWKSKSQDSDWQQYTLPRRVDQADFAASLVNEVTQSSSPANVILLGDLNDHPDSAPLAHLLDSGMLSTVNRLAPSDRYTYIYRGISQLLDHILLSPTLIDGWIQADVIHINADIPEVFEGVSGSPFRSSDHDPLVLRITILPYQLFIPLGVKNGAGSRMESAHPVVYHADR